MADYDAQLDEPYLPQEDYEAFVNADIVAVVSE
jgi:hypothetical protein